MSTKNELSRITIDIPKLDHKKLKAMAAILGKSMQTIVRELIEECLKSSHYPNKTTIKAIKDAQAGKGLVKSDSLDDLFKKLGI
jgi:antitoxin component of RelBE/YafQ-DinJ toxin-antitoxin module